MGWLELAHPGRYTPAPAAQAAHQGRVVATGLTPQGHALAFGGDGQWLTSWAALGNTSGNLIIIGGSSSRVLGRFVYEAP